MKKTLILIGILSSYSVFALEGSINTGIKLSPEFSPLVEDKANGMVKHLDMKRVLMMPNY